MATPASTGVLTPDDSSFDTFCHMVIEEYLMRKKLTSTLEMFREEWEDRPSEDTAMISWYEVAMRLRLPDVIEAGSKDMTVLENMSNAIIKDSSVRARRGAEMIAQGLAAMPKKTLLPEITQVNMTDGGVDAGATGSISSAQMAGDSYDDGDEMGSKMGSVGSGSRGGASLHTKKSANASVAALQKIKEAKAEAAKQAKLDEPKVSKAHSHVDLSPEAAANVQRELDKVRDEELKTGRSRKPKVSNENWINDLERTRSLERDFKVLKNNLSDIQLREMQERREMKQFMVSDLEKARNAESLGQTKRRQCGCCLLQFLPINLPLKVSQKAVLDIRVKWGGKLTSKTVFGGTNPPIGEYLSTSMDPVPGALDATATSADGTVGLASGAPSGTTSTVEPAKKSYLDKLSERLSVVPRCYSDVPVCTFCAQFFQDQDEYRPSYDKIVRSEKKTEYLATMARDKEYWDPLTAVEKEREEAILMEEAAIAAGLAIGTNGGHCDVSSVASNSVLGDGMSVQGSIA